MNDSLELISNDVENCKKCPLFKYACHGVPGEGPSNAKIFFLGQAPGVNEDKTGRPFIGRAGQYLTKRMEEIGLRREDCFITSAVKHFPPANRTPTHEEIAACQPYLIRQLKLINPKLVVLLGKSAQTIKGNPALDGRIVFEVIHPSAAMRFTKMAERMKREFQELKKIVERF